MGAVPVVPSVWAVGVKDPGLAVFDIVIPTEHGTTYNSYLVKGTEKTALVDCVKRPFAAEWLANVSSLVEPEKVDYLVVNHSEPDHSGAIVDFLARHPGVTVLSSRSAKSFVDNLVNAPYNHRVVNDGEEIDLGGKTLRFIHAPFLHWPDTIFTYAVEDRVLFPCDFLGSHYSSPEYFDDELSAVQAREKDAAFEFYYSTIMRPWREHILEGCRKLEGVPLSIVAPSHGPILRKDPQAQLSRYRERASMASRVEGKRVPVVYATSYGNTAAMAEKVVEGLKAGGVVPVLLNVVETPEETLLDELEKASGVLIGTPTLNATVPHPILHLIGNMVVLNLKRKPASVFGSYGWSGEAIKTVSDIMTTMGMRVTPEPIRVRLTPSAADLEACVEFGKKFAEAVIAGK
jgi:flavorubredoxin